MIFRFGIILLDWNEIVIRIYDRNEQGCLKLIYHHIKDVNPNKKDFPIATQICEKFITAVIEKTESLQIKEWKISARYLPESKVRDIASKVGLNIEKLTLQQEQDLICRGLLT